MPVISTGVLQVAAAALETAEVVSKFLSSGVDGPATAPICLASVVLGLLYGVCTLGLARALCAWEEGA